MLLFEGKVQANRASSRGSTRCESVFEGLKFLDSQSRADDWCLVHDAARPCVQTKDILELIDVLKNSNTGGVLDTCY